MPIFTRRGYITIGKAIRNATGLNANARQIIVRELCKVFRDDNYSFREDVFRAIANAELGEDPVLMRNPTGKNGR